MFQGHVDHFFRLLYDTGKSAYVTLDHVADMIMKIPFMTPMLGPRHFMVSICIRGYAPKKIPGKCQNLTDKLY
ncbi:MAG: hypothetical protein JRG79_11445 [Deltaproteobacteria bacterium]|nr:hypothetical protein [Deltaproteobacteria bacterium]